MNVQAMAGMAPAFNIRWDATRAAYFVDKPNIGDTAVYTAEQVAALQQQLAAAREALQAAEVDAARYRWLRDSPRCSLTVNHNDHHCMYQSVADTMDDTQDYYSDVPEDEKARMIATDSIWTVHEYPNTPVGFNVYHAATLDTAIDEAIATLQRDRQP